MAKVRIEIEMPNSEKHIICEQESDEIPISGELWLVRMLLEKTWALTEKELDKLQGSERI